MESLAIMVFSIVLVLIAFSAAQWSLKKVGLGKLLPGIGITVVSFFGLVVFLVWKKSRKKP